MSPRILILGSGAREHALAWKLAKDVGWEQIRVAPGNGGIPGSVPIDMMNFPAIKDYCEAQKISLIVAGSEAPLVQGLQDYFMGSAIRVFGPGKLGARLEGSKIHAKRFMKAHHVSTARFEEFQGVSEAEKYLQKHEEPCVIKYDGLAAGKGVFVCSTSKEALEALRGVSEKFGSDAQLLIEEKLEGKEVSMIGITDGKDIRLFASSRDHKRAFDHDQGPNTGGMGAVCPVADLDENQLSQIKSRIITPTLDGLRAEKIFYCGFIYFGIILTAEGPKLLEYNTRLGDPEAAVILPALKTSLLSLVEAALSGELEKQKIQTESGTFIDVVFASGGYPGDYRTGGEITGLDQLDTETLVFHAGTGKRDGKYFAQGGRVLNLVCHAENLAAASQKTYQECKKIHFEKCHYRRDIGR